MASIFACFAAHVEGATLERLEARYGKTKCMWRASPTGSHATKKSKGRFPRQSKRS
jgi:hypothetical protein